MTDYVRFLLSKVGGRYENWMQRRLSGYQFPGEVEEIRDIPYMNDGENAHRMNVYRPRSGGKNLPVILNLHGGGLVLCTRDVNRPLCAELAKRGFLVFCLDYPLVPQVTVPQMLNDVCRAMDRAGDLIPQFGGDPDRVFLVGDSSGAFLSVYAAAVRKSQAVAAAAGVKPSALDIKGMGLISGMLHTAACDSTGFFLRSDFYGKDWRNHPLLPYLKPERHEIASLMPPVFLITGWADSLRRSTVRFHRGLKQAGIPVQMQHYPLKMEFCHDFVAMYPERDGAQKAMDEMVDFLLEKTPIDK